MYLSVCVVRRVRVVDRPPNSGAGRSRSRAAGCIRACGGGHSAAAGRCGAADDSDSEDEASFQNYDDPDDGQSPVPPLHSIWHTWLSTPWTQRKGLPRNGLIFFFYFFLLI